MNQLGLKPTEDIWKLCFSSDMEQRLTDTYLWKQDRCLFDFLEEIW